jgi:serine/threonine protein kinase
MSVFPNATLGNYVLEHLISDELTTQVWAGFRADTHQPVVLKIPKPRCVQIRREEEMLPLVEHGHIIKLQDVVGTENGACLVLPYAFGGDLYGMVSAGSIGEDETRTLIFHILGALNHLHKESIWHRDVKPENILLMRSDCDLNSAVLSDFGFSGKFDQPCWNDYCGSPHYCAPELYLQKPYNEKIDIWALGITMFVCLTGALPYNSTQTRAMVREITSGLPHLLEFRGLAQVSIEGRDLLRKMLTKEADARISAEEALCHPWFDCFREETDFCDARGCHGGPAECECDTEDSWPGESRWTKHAGMMRCAL